MLNGDDILSKNEDILRRSKSMWQWPSTCSSQSMTHDQVIASIQHFYMHVKSELMEVNVSTPSDEFEANWLQAQRAVYEELLSGYEKLFEDFLSIKII